MKTKKKQKKIRLRYKKERVVLSDVLPYELPITFSNRYFYRFLVKNRIEVDIDADKGKVNNRDGMSEAEQLVMHLLLGMDPTDNTNKKAASGTIPFSYRVLHKEGKYRELTIVHPAEQIKMVEFYEKYSSLMLYYCQQSRFSLRHPSAKACYFYYRDRLHSKLIGKRSDKVELFMNEYENLRTYFSYKKYPQLYRFYEDYSYQRAEKKFAFLQKFDIQSCFNSIYTHSIAWAVGGGRQTYKMHYTTSDFYMNGFGEIWDGLMQSLNYKETNGIVIGPEFSRLFAETILQHIDVCVERDLLEQGFRWKVDYECYRFVDDHFFFYNDPKVLNAARESYARHLNDFKMTISSEKTQDFVRPFITPVSRAKLAVNDLLRDTIDLHLTDDEKISVRSHDDDVMADDDSDNDDDLETDDPDVAGEVVPKNILEAIERKYRLSFPEKTFCARFQDILLVNGIQPKDISNYTMACLATRCERTLKKFDTKLYKPLCKATICDALPIEERAKAREKREKLQAQLSVFLFNLIDGAFFIYGLNRRMNSTLKLMNLLNTIIVYLDHDYKVYQGKKELGILRRFTDDIRSTVFQKIQNEVDTVMQAAPYSEDTQLETLHLLVALRSLHSKYHLPASTIRKYLGIQKTADDGKTPVMPRMNAITITLLLYYFGGRSEFGTLRQGVVETAVRNILEVPKQQRCMSAECTILLLDLMACSYLTPVQKHQIGKAYGLGKGNVQLLIDYFKRPGRYMFTTWQNLNVTKELNAKMSQEVYA